MDTVSATYPTEEQKPIFTLAGETNGTTTTVSSISKYVKYPPSYV